VLHSAKYFFAECPDKLHSAKPGTLSISQLSGIDYSIGSIFWTATSSNHATHHQCDYYYARRKCNMEHKRRVWTANLPRKEKLSSGNKILKAIDETGMAHSWGF
jgi:hypothetical protein